MTCKSDSPLTHVSSKGWPREQASSLLSPSRGRCFHDWPPAAEDDLCRVAFQARVTHLSAAWIVATEVGPDPQAGLVGKCVTLSYVYCGYAGGLEVLGWRTGGG